ncbi:MAG: hypothetical protein HKN25_06180 [Pyrinomonadaceae bacterium]|nr:hypothetical protein [Pyrinomonadaceae bacterium]
MTFGRKFISIVTIALAVVALSTVSFGQETPATTEKPDSVKKDGKRSKYGRRGMHRKGGKRGYRRGRRGGRSALRGITLSDSQKQQMQTLLQSKRGERRPSAGNEEMRKLMGLKRSGLATSAQEAELKTMMDKRKAERDAARKQMDASIRSILTAEQQEQYDKNLAERKQMMEKRKSMRKERKGSQMKSN